MIPKLRFQEFTGNYNHNTFKDYVVINQGLQIAISERLNSPLEGAYFYITNEFLRSNSLKSYWVKNPPKSSICSYEDILMTRTGNTGIVVTDVQGVFHNNFFKIKYRSNYFNKVWLVEYLRRNAIQKQILRYAGTSTIPDLNHKDFYRLPLLHPAIDEQTKIANLLSVLNSKINLLTKKKEALETYKKGLMQKIFSQELRFKRENGTDYPEWERKELIDIMDYEQPTKYIVDSTEYSDHFKTPVLTAGKTFILGFTDEDKNHFTDFPVIIFDDFTTAFKFVDFAFKVKSSAMKILRPRENVNVRFVYEAMKIIRFPKGEHKRYWISEYCFMKIPFPSEEEQHRIAALSVKFDQKTDAVDRELETIQKLKKGLLQQMFV